MPAPRGNRISVRAHGIDTDGIPSCTVVAARSLVPLHPLKGRLQVIVEARLTHTQGERQAGELIERDRKAPSIRVHLTGHNRGEVVCFPFEQTLRRNPLSVRFPVDCEQGRWRRDRIDPPLALELVPGPTE